MKAVQLKPDIYWVGAVDWAVRDFHGYVTPNGTTYNDYLILDEQPTLLDTVKAEFAEVTVSSIGSLIVPAKIVNVVVNHIEPDHAGSMSKIMALAPNATIWITEKGRAGLDRYCNTTGWKIRTVKTGDTLKTGKRTLLFVETPMLHWPDSMVTYVKEDKLLISQDAFGQHYASASRFDAEFVASHSATTLEDAVTEYYANILMPFGNLIKSKIADIQKLELEIDMIAPDHGVIWREYPGKVLKMYVDMASGKAAERVVIIYDTMWHSTEQMASPIAQGIKDAGVDVKVLKLRATPMSAAVTEFWKSRGCLVGTPTLNNTMFPSVAEFLAHLGGLRPKDRVVGVFGSYGWSGGAVKEAYEAFKKMKLEAVEPGVQVVYRPSAEDIRRCYDFGREFAARVRSYNAGTL